MLSEREKSVFKYEIHVREKEIVIVYFSDTIDFSNSPFVTFQPKYKIDLHDKGEMSGEVLTFPSHLIVKIIHRTG